MNVNAAILGLTCELEKYAALGNRRKKRSNIWPAVGLAGAAGAAGAAGLAGLYMYNRRNSAEGVNMRLVKGMGDAVRNVSPVGSGITTDAINQSTGMNLPSGHAVGVDNTQVNLQENITPIVGAAGMVGLPAWAAAQAMRFLPKSIASSALGRGLSTVGRVVAPPIGAAYGFQSGANPLMAEAFGDTLRGAGVDIKDPTKVQALSGAVMGAVGLHPLGAGLTFGVVDPVLAGANDALLYGSDHTRMGKLLKPVIGSTAGAIPLHYQGTSGDLLLENLRKIKNNTPDNVNAVRDINTWLAMNKQNLPGWKTGNPVLHNLAARASAAANVGHDMKL